MLVEPFASCDFADAFVAAEAASLAPSVETTELFLDDGPGRCGVSNPDPDESLLSRRSEPSFADFSPSGALGTGATVIQDLMGCRWDCTWESLSGFLVRCVGDVVTVAEAAEQAVVVGVFVAVGAVVATGMVNVVATVGVVVAMEALVAVVAVELSIAVVVAVELSEAVTALVVVEG
jgi:hypothetical protein